MSTEFKIGQKVRISDEAPRSVLVSFPDGVGWVTKGVDRDGDYKVSSRKNDSDGAGVYVRGIRLSAVEDEPEVIDFDEVMIGDTVRQTITNSGGDTMVKTITVSNRDHWGGLLVGKNSGSDFSITKSSSMSSNSTLELLKRTFKEYKVGDRVGFADLKHLKTDTVLKNTGSGTLRILDQDRQDLVGREDKMNFDEISRNVGYIIVSIPEGK